MSMVFGRRRVRHGYAVVLDRAERSPAGKRNACLLDFTGSTRVTGQEHHGGPFCLAAGSYVEHRVCRCTLRECLRITDGSACHLIRWREYGRRQKGPTEGRRKNETARLHLSSLNSGVGARRFQAVIKRITRLLTHRTLGPSSGGGQGNSRRLIFGSQNAPWLPIEDSPRSPGHRVRHDPAVETTRSVGRFWKPRLQMPTEAPLSTSTRLVPAAWIVCRGRSTLSRDDRRPLPPAAGESRARPPAR